MNKSTLASVPVLAALPALLALVGSAGATTISVHSVMDGTWSQFNTTDFFAADAGFSSGTSNPPRFRTNVFDGQGHRQPWLKWSGAQIDAALTAVGKTRADIASVRFEITYRNPDEADRVASAAPANFSWSLFGINDGVTNEDFTHALLMSQMPGWNESTALPPPNVYNRQDLSEATLFDGFTLNKTTSPTQVVGGVISLAVPPSFVQSDTNNVLSFMYHQVQGERSAYVPVFYGTSSTGAELGFRPRLVMVVPEPASLGLLAGVGLLAARRRRR